MKFIVAALTGLCLFIFFASQVNADQNISRNISSVCKVELDAFCKDVTPGKGRVLSCLYAYSDKLSDPCRHAVLDAAEQAKLMGAALSYLKNECGDDLNRLCKDVAPGEGRLMDCLEKHDDKISRKCKLALKEVGLRD